MSNLDLYMPLLEKAAAICQLEELVNNVDLDKKEKRKASKALDELKPELINETQELVSKSFESWESGAELVSHLVYELDAVKAAADDSWHPAIGRLKELLIEQTQKEARKSPLRRKIEKHSWWIIILTIIVVVFSIRFYTSVEVTGELTEKSGFLQRGEAFQKVLRYDDWMDTRVRKGGAFKSIIFWPIKPTEKEIEYAGEFIGAVNEVYNHLLTENIICNASRTYNGDNLEASKDLWDFVQSGGHSQEMNKSTNTLEMIAVVFIEKFPCGN